MLSEKQKMFQKRLMKGIKVFQKKKKAKSKKMVVRDIEIFLEKEKTITISMVLNDKEMFEKLVWVQKMLVENV